MDSEAAFEHAAQILNCKLERFRKSARVSQADKLSRDLLIYLMWQSGQLTNRQISETFGITYSAVSRKVGAFKDLLMKNNKLQNKLDLIKALINI